METHMHPNERLWSQRKGQTPARWQSVTSGRLTWIWRMLHWHNSLIIQFDIQSLGVVKLVLMSTWRLVKVKQLSTHFSFMLIQKRVFITSHLVKQNRSQICVGAINLPVFRSIYRSVWCTNFFVTYHLAKSVFPLFRPRLCLMRRGTSTGHLTGIYKRVYSASKVSCKLTTRNKFLRDFVFFL